MIPTNYRYEMIKKWCSKNNYKIDGLSKKLFGATTRITRLKDLNKGKSKSDCKSEWDIISKFTGLDFSDPLQSEELRNIISFLMKHLDTYGNTTLSQELYQCFESIDLLKYLESHGYKVDVSFVSHPIEQFVIFNLKK